MLACKELHVTHDAGIGSSPHNALEDKWDQMMDEWYEKAQQWEMTLSILLMPPAAWAVCLFNVWYIYKCISFKGDVL